MDAFRITGGPKLRGRVRVGGAKNSALKLMATSLLAPGRTTITNVPAIVDVSVMCEVLRRLDCTVTYDNETVTIDVPEIPGTEADYDLVRRMRASINVLGPLLARRGEVKVAHPGGDVIGTRGLDYHIAGLQQMGAEITSEHGFVIARARRLHGAKIWLEFPSVGATENLLSAAALAEGTTVIENAAREPEIGDICAMLSSMGAHIEGAGTSTVTVEGVESLNPVTHRTISDRIITGTWAFAAVISQGDVIIDGGIASHTEIVLDKLATAGAKISIGDESIRITMDGQPRAVDIVTLPYPGFATDMLPMAMALAAVSDGHSLLTENVFDARFMLVNEMLRLGASIRTDGHHAVVRGKEWLSGAQVAATDIRAGAGLVLAALRAEGTTEISNVQHIDRGYPAFVPQLQSLGAQIERVAAPEPSFLTDDL